MKKSHFLCKYKIFNFHIRIAIRNSLYFKRRKYILISWYTLYNLLLLHHLSFVFSFIEGCTIVETWWNTCFLNMYSTTWRKWNSSSLDTDHFSWTDASWTSRCQSAFRLNDPLYSLLKIHSERVYLYFSLFLIFFFYAWVLKLML